MDLDGVTAAGAYTYVDSCTHTPTSGVWGVLAVFKSGRDRSEVAQLAVYHGGSKTRWLYGNPLSWSPWT